MITMELDQLYPGLLYPFRMEDLNHPPALAALFDHLGIQEKKRNFSSVHTNKREDMKGYKGE